MIILKLCVTASLYEVHTSKLAITWPSLGHLSPFYALLRLSDELSFCRLFRYGLMDAGAMVDLALNWTNVPPQRVCEAQAPITGGPVSVRPMSRENLALTTDGCASAAARAGDPSQRVVYLEHVQAKVSIFVSLSEACITASSSAFSFLFCLLNFHSFYCAN